MTFLNARACKAILSGLLLVLLVALITRPSITRREIEDLDEAHHVMDGIFFADLFGDHPFEHLSRYPFDYYRQYPALGFTFWPPFYPFVEGIFFSVYGLDIIAARLCMFAFCLLLCWCMYTYSEPIVGSMLAVLGVCLTLSSPLVATHCNMIMLEIPALAMAFLTVVLYKRISERGQWKGWGEVCLFSLCAAAALYTKQTIVFFLPAILLDAAVNQRKLLREPKTLAASLLVVALCLPLALFTLQYGGVNLAQSFGSRGDIYVTGHKGPSRWTLGGWVYYAHLLLSLVNPFVCCVAGAGLAYGVVKPEFLRKNALVIGWAVSWYVMFSLFDNKQPRFVTFVVPAFIILALHFLCEVTGHLRMARVIGYCGLTLLVASQVAAIIRADSVGYSGIDRIVSDMLGTTSGNIAYVGHFRQMFVPWVRIIDSERRVHVLQGDDITSVSRNFSTACHDFRVQWILVEDTEDKAGESDGIRKELAGPLFELFREDTFGPPKSSIGLKIYRYLGSISERIKTVPLRSEIQRISHE